MQSDIRNKLQHFQIAKQFYSYAKNARSFLINIYTSYFEILLKIRQVIEEVSIDKREAIKINAKYIKIRINERTVEKFPDSDKLIFFLDIISMFNEIDEETQDQLFGYIRKYRNEEKYKDVRTIAKITLANNFLISESRGDADFNIKNLKFILNYLSNGILSLEESPEDRNAREIKEEVLYCLLYTSRCV